MHIVRYMGNLREFLKFPVNHDAAINRQKKKKAG